MIFFRFPGLLLPDELVDLPHGFVSGFLQEAAGVDHGHVTALGTEGDLVPGFIGFPDHLLTVDLILGAAKGEEADLGDGDLDFFGFLAFLRFLYVMFLHGVLLSCCVSRFDISAARCRRRSETRKSPDALRHRRLFYIPCGLPGPEAFWPGRRRWLPLRRPSQPGHPPNRLWAPGGGRARF